MTPGDGRVTDIAFHDAILPAIWQRPADARACLVLAHGAGAGMQHRRMASPADSLAERGVATLRFDIPFSHALPAGLVEVLEPTEG